MTVGLNIHIEEEQGVVVVRMEGRLDAASAPGLERKLIELLDKKKTNLILDFAEVDYLSSAGMRLLLSITKKLKGGPGGLHCCSVNEEVMEIIKMAGFERIIKIYPTEHEALQGFSK